MNAVELLKTIIIRHKYKSLLDIGCGEGRTTRDIKQAVPWVEVEGVDIAEAYIAHAKKHFPEVKFRVRDARTMKFKKKFNVGFTHGFFIHVPPKDIRRTIKKVMKICKEGLFIESSGKEKPGYLHYDPGIYWNGRAARTERNETDANTQYYFSHNYEKLFNDLGFSCETIYEFDLETKTRLYLCRR